MKQFTLIIALFFSIFASSQNEDPNLIRTWYLTFIQANDLAVPFIISDISPEITPNLTISEGFILSGNAACNSFYGTFTDSSSGLFSGSQISQTLLICETEVHNSFEQTYFNFFSSPILMYSISTVEGGQKLTFTHPLMGSAIFYDFLLQLQVHEKEEIQLFPNPSRDKLSLSNPNIIKVDIYNTSGQYVQSIFSEFENINIANLQSGLYLLKISTNLGFTYKKFLKI